MMNAKTFVLLAVIAVNANAGNGLFILFQHLLARALRYFHSFREHNSVLKYSEVSNTDINRNCNE